MENVTRTRVVRVTTELLAPPLLIIKLDIEFFKLAFACSRPIGRPKGLVLSAVSFHKKVNVKRIQKKKKHSSLLQISRKKPRNRQQLSLNK